MLKTNILNVVILFILKSPPEMPNPTRDASIGTWKWLAPFLFFIFNLVLVVQLYY